MKYIKLIIYGFIIFSLVNGCVSYRVDYSQEEKDLFSKTKGDFKIIKLGDSKEIVKKKLQYLSDISGTECFSDIYEPQCRYRFYKF
jgi:hypothetical protein